MAKLANVSAKTISRVVNNLPGVGPKKRAEIEKLIEETGFRPNFGARVLASSRSYIICMIVFEQTSHYYFSELQIGISRACIAAGYHLIVEPVGAVIDQGKQAIERRFAALRPDGFIVVPPVSEALPFLEDLKALNYPFVRVAPVADKDMSSFVEMDDERAVYEITSQLIGQGHRDLAWISVGRNLASMPVREAGFRRAMGEAGIPIRADLMVVPQPETSYGHEEAFAMLSRPDRPTAIVGGNDSVALAAIAAAQRAGLMVPKDVSVVGFDDSPGSESCWPPMTTVHQPIAELGQKATEILLRHLDRDQPITGYRNVKVDFDIVYRASSGPRPAKG